MSKLWRWRKVVSPSIVPSGNFAELIRTVTLHGAEGADQRQAPAREEMRVEESTHSELEMSEGLPENPESWLWQRHGEASHVLGNRALQKFPDP
ncbi:hypothetical protein TNCV_986881 [Trichonephila clavipes]|nr:hypothetical protein TNCV_986881 [Trichonephila clavipes]